MPAMETQPTRVLWRSSLGADEIPNLPHPNGVSILVEPDRASARERMAGVRILVDGRPDEALLDAPDLRHVIVPYAGIHDAVRRRLAERPHLTLHNSHFNAPFVAQHAFSLLLSTAARLGRYDASLRRGDWGARSGPESVHLAGGEALLLGYGAIGRALVPMLRGVGMEVVALRRRPDASAESPLEVGRDDLHDALGRARAVIVTLPATEATSGMLDEAAFDAVRPGTLLVNVGRGGVIDEDALWNALERGRLAGVGLDVWWRYPDGEEARRATLPSKRPFHLHPDVVLSPHRANAVAGWREASARDVLETIARLASGGEERNRVDVQAGY